MKKKKVKIKAFTLLELMIVIGIIACLAMVALAWVQRARQQALLSTCVSSMRNVAIGVEQYMADSGNQMPPPDLDALVPNYLRITPTNTKGVKYEYLFEPVSRAYTIYCPGLGHSGLGVPADYPRYCSPGGQTFGMPGFN
jgi:prepilin-type N-terminal cleavage/methylation domain-containing protein